MIPLRPSLPRVLATRVFLLVVWLAAGASTVWSLVVLGVAGRPMLLGVGSALVFAAAVSAVVRKVRSPLRRALAVLLTAALGATLVHFTIRPGADRAWAFEMDRTPGAEIHGDVVTVHNFRNFSWSADPAQNEARWETRTYHLTQLRGVDLVMAYWGSPHMSHTMASFDFGDEGHVCVSIEARREQGEKYSPTLGAFRRYELLYVLGAESDLIRLRTQIRRNEVYRYRLQLDASRVRRQFEQILAAANRVRLEPAWYHTLTCNCTTEILLHDLLLAARDRWSWRVAANGHLDELLYERGDLDRSLPFPELKRRSRLTAP